MSHTVAAALRHYCEKGLLPPEVCQTADFLEQWDNLFDLGNSVSISQRGTKAPVATQRLNDALQHLQNALEWVSQWQFEDQRGNRQTTRVSLPFQKGLLITLSALSGLISFLILERGFSYVCTRRFTQDCAETLFSAIRWNRGGFNDHPESQSAIQSLRFATCAQLLDNVSKGANCANTADRMLLQLGKKLHNIILYLI